MIVETPQEAEEKIAELAEAVGDNGQIEIKHEHDENGKFEASVIRVRDLDIEDDTEHLIAHYGFFIKPESYRKGGISLFRRVFVRH